MTKDFIRFNDRLAVRKSEIASISIPDDSPTEVYVLLKGNFQFKLNHKTEQIAQQVFNQTMNQLDPQI